MRTSLTLWIATICVLSCSVSAFAAETILYNSNGFEAFNAGASVVGQLATDPAANQWQRFGGSPGGFTVASGAGVGGSIGLQANGGGENDGTFVWPNIGYTPAAGEKIRIQVDIARTLSASVADSSPVYAVDIYDAVFNRTSRFGLQTNNGAIEAFISVPIDVAGGPIVPGGALIRSEFYGSPIQPGTFAHFDFLMDYTAKTVDMSVNGTLLASNVPFRTNTSTFLDSAELQVGTFNNISNDNGYFDNYIVSVVTVPEPATLVMMSLGLGAVVLVKSRRKQSDV